MSRYSFVILILFIFPSGTKSQINNQVLKSDTAQKEWVLKGFIYDQGKLWTAPYSAFSNQKSEVRSQKSAFIYLTVIAATALAIVYDEKIQSNIQDIVHRNKGIRNIGSIITNGGGVPFAVSVCGLFYLGGLAFNDDKAKQTGFLTAYALANTAIIITVGKVITGRQRPDADNGVDKWHWLSDYRLQITNGKLKTKGFDNFHNSFPSGHSAVAWTFATVISSQYNDKMLVAPIAYTLATAVTLSRLTEYRHWLSDVIMGSAIGFGIGKYVVNHHRNTKWTLLPVYYEKIYY